MALPKWLWQSITITTNMIIAHITMITIMTRIMSMATKTTRRTSTITITAV